MGLAKGTEGLTVDWFGALVTGSGIDFSFIIWFFVPTRDRLSAGQWYGLLFPWQGVDSIWKQRYNTIHKAKY